MRTYNLSVLAREGFSLSDLDLLVKNKVAKFAYPQGNTALTVNLNEAYEFIEQYKEYNRKYR